MDQNILQNSKTMIAALAACAVIVIILIVVVATSGGPAVSEKDVQSLQSGLNALEERVDALAFSEDRIDRLRDRIGELEKITSEFGKLEADLMFRISDLEAKLGVTADKVTDTAQAQQQETTAKTAAKTSVKTSKPAAAKADASAKTPDKQASGDIWYQVRKGDTVYSISRKHGLTVEALKTMNSLNSNKIFPGQKLRVKR
ncbi:MAG: LysM peptidoglycan-binding domain-containing protein [Thermodesulfobacteriota bacterium]|nr:LysM peptidoglycan-binding domain-containing protein [Thermodesulfobacteriota bacterium]